MYTIDSLENAIRDLYYSGIASADYESASVEAMLDSIDFFTLLQAIRHHVRMVHIYTTQGKAPQSFTYRSGELFGQRATRLYEDFDQAHQNGEVMAGRTYELWLLEDMSLAAVACVSIGYDKGVYVTQYREISGECGAPWDSGLCLNLEELTSNLLGMCKPFSECNMPIYEL
ncbi:MAG: hypothetical protein K2O18_04895 [Oscillospiraceae bacterium]|nr:hypothetical protein [Oscillospiraceae bacterium]